MDLQTTIIGYAALCFGFCTLLLRFISPGRLKSLPVLRERLGAGLGTAIHVVGYTLIPLLFGTLTLFQ